MQNPRFAVVLNTALASLAAGLLFTAVVVAAGLGQAYHFDGHNGHQPQAGLVIDSAGNLYGTTAEGGGHKGRKCPEGCGVAFEIGLDANGEFKEKVIHRFSGSDNGDGALPVSGLIFDSAGNLYGTTAQGGSTACGGSGPSQGGCGVVFELTPAANGEWTETILYTFTDGNDGGVPQAGLIFDGAGNLYSTAGGGGANNAGVVFELTPQANGQWNETILHAFSNSGGDGADPFGGLIFDGAGNLYGTTAFGGGASNGGIVFELSSGANNQWSETILHTFAYGQEGAVPMAGLTFDGAGNLYCTTIQGGGGGGGSVFELTPGSGGIWTVTTLHNFSEHADGNEPFGGVIFDGAGNLYGTTREGGVENDGVVFRLTPQADGQWTETAYHLTGGNGGADPVAGVVFDSVGNLYGTAEYDSSSSACGTNGCGVVFRLNSGALQGHRHD